jgi:hypothetical protein
VAILRFLLIKDEFLLSTRLLATALSPRQLARLTLSIWWSLVVAVEEALTVVALSVPVVVVLVATDHLWWVNYLAKTAVQNRKFLLVVLPLSPLVVAVQAQQALTLEADKEVTAFSVLLHLSAVVLAVAAVTQLRKAVLLAVPVVAVLLGLLVVLAVPGLVTKVLLVVMALMAAVPVPVVVVPVVLAQTVLVVGQLRRLLVALGFQTTLQALL